MNKYSSEFIAEARQLRKDGKTYKEISQILGVNIPKGTLSQWFKDIVLSNEYYERMALKGFKRLLKFQQRGVRLQKSRRKRYLLSLDKNNKYIANKAVALDIGKIALAMLCLGEASKSSSKSSRFCFSNSNAQIILLFLEFLKQRKDFDSKKIRCRVQCRADQRVEFLEDYWHTLTKVPIEQFTKTQIDPRTIGRPTRRKHYHGVLAVDYHDRNAQFDLESLAFMVYSRLCINKGP